MRSKHDKKKTLRDILVVIVIVLSFISVYFGLRFFLSTDTPLVVVGSGSMSPTLEVGDIIIVGGVKPEEIKVGDIIVFDEPTKGITTVHRVVDIQPLSNGTLTFKTKGDANTAEDAYAVYPKSIHGRFLGKIPYVGYLFLSPLILIIIVTVVIVLIIVWPEDKKRKHKIHVPRVD